MVDHCKKSERERERERVWTYLREHHPIFTGRDSNACFSEICEEETIRKIMP